MKKAFFHGVLAVISLSGIAGALAARTYKPEEVVGESKKANDFFERTFQEYVNRHPETQTELGIKRDYDKWDDDSEAHETEELVISAQQLVELKRTVNYEALDPQTQVSYRLWTRRAEHQIEGFKWRFHTYPVNQMFGVQSEVAAFLINMHGVSDVKDAQAYIARLRGIRQKFDTLIAELEARRQRGIIPPRFVFPIVIDSCRDLIAGQPFDESSAKNPLWRDFGDKLDKLSEVDSATKERLKAEAKLALLSSVKPAYEGLIGELQSLEKNATNEDGVWKFPEGAAFYDFALSRSTTTSLTAEQIYDIGLKEVARIHEEMTKIKEKVGFHGDLAAFFKFMREDPRFYFPNTAEGQAAYLKGANEIIDKMRARLDDLFLTKPKAALVVKPVEAFRSKGAPPAFYEQPAMDGSRPGTYYVNLYDMSGQPKYEMEALAYHEGIPGHHMQIAIAQELTGLPMFRKVGYGYTAYIEGWGLYCERIPKEMGFYAEPYSDFGRLSMELWRAARLVVDTGIHAKKWTRQQTIDWLHSNTPNSDRDITSETNRYIVMPGQATAYKIGMLKLLELRDLAVHELGPKFDVRQYHDIVLKNGALPLDILEEQVRAWIAATKT